jgi:hypothetical protein
MTSANRRQLHAVLDELANALQAALGLATHLRRNAQTIADDAVALETAVGRAVSVLKRAQPGKTREGGWR